MGGTLIGSLTALAKTALSLTPGGALAVKFGEQVVDTIDRAKERFAADQDPPSQAEMAALDEARDALEKRVSDHVDQVADKLRGN